MRLTPSIQRIGDALVAQFLKLGNPDDYEQWLNRQPDWEPLDVNHSGSFKTVFMNRDLVVKFDAVPTSEHCAVETETWLTASRAKRRHLAKIIAHAPGLIIQERVPAPCSRAKCRKAEDCAKRLHIFDWDANHSHRNREVVFFDYDPYGGKYQ